MSLHRREVLTAAAAASLAAVLPPAAEAQKPADDPNWPRSIVQYLQSLARSDGGYGWDGQDHSHLTPTFAVVGCYRLLGIEPPNKKALAEYIRTHHPRELKGRLEQEHRQFDWQQIQSLVWLGEDVSAFSGLVETWKGPIAYLKQYEQHGYPVFQQEVSAVLSRRLLGLPMEDTPATYIEYLTARRRTNGSFNNTPASDGSDGHVLNTWWGLRALEALGSAREQKSETIEWLQACQLPNGGFTYQPKPSIGNLDDVAYTWGVVRAIAHYGAKLANEDKCGEYLRSLYNDDGGFGDRPGWLSNPLATYYALDALAALEMLKESPGGGRPTRAISAARPSDDLRVFSIQLEAHGQGSPAEAVELADALCIHLWGAKNAKHQWLARAQAIAAERGVHVKFFASNEEYGTWINVPGLGTYSHMSDVLGPSSDALGPSLAGSQALAWPDFAYRRLGFERTYALSNVLRPAKARADARPDCRLVWQFGENEPLVRMLLDDSLVKLSRLGGFAAISTYHFGNPDFTNTEPFLMRYRGQIPFVALQDAHGAEPWWFADMTEGFRTLFLARQPTWSGWLEALANNWVVAVRHDAVSGGKTWMHGMPDVIDFVKERWRDWQWWKNPTIERPLVSVVALTPRDELEVGRPEKGVAIRVRCAWENTTQGLPKKPIAELASLLLDDKPVKVEHVIRRRPNGPLDDDYHLYACPDPPSGKHTVTAVVRRLADSSESKRSIAFDV